MTVTAFRNQEHRRALGGELTPRKWARLACSERHVIDEALAAGLPAMAQALRVFFEENEVAILLSAPNGRISYAPHGGAHALESGSDLIRVDADWSEASLGNNGVGTACLLRRPVAFGGSEHSAVALQAFVTAGSPILAPGGEICAVIGLIARRRACSQTMLALLAFLRLASRTLEERLLERWSGQGYMLRLQVLDGASTLTGASSLADGKLLVSSEGEILGANRAALDILGGNFSDLIGKYLTQDFGWQAWRFLSMSDLTSVSEHVVARTQQRIRVDAIRVGSVVAPTEASGCSTIASRSLATWEEHAVRWVLAMNGGNVARAARDLGITRATLYHKMDRYGIRSERR